MYLNIKITTFFLSNLFFFQIIAKEMNFNNLISSENNWEFISDQVMGGISFGKKEFLNKEDIPFIRMTGYVSLENNGGFIQIRHKFKTNLQEANGLKIRVRGNDKNYKIHIRTKYTILPWQYYSATFHTNEDWKLINFKFTEFSRSGKLLPKNIKSKHISSVAIVAFGQEFRAKIDISELEFY